MLKISGAVLSAALLVSIFAISPANAAVQLSITDNTVSNTQVVNDCTGGFLGCLFYQDSDPTKGVIVATVNQDNDITSHHHLTEHNVNSASVSAAGSPALPMGQLSLTDLDIESAGPTTIVLWLTNTDLTAPTGPSILNEALSATSLSGNVTVTLQGYEDNTNSFYGMQSPGQLLSVTPIANGAAASAGASSNVINFDSPYSLTEVATLTFLTAGDLNLNFTGTLSASPVPEPASLLLFGTVLAGVGFVMRKRLQTGNLV